MHATSRPCDVFPDPCPVRTVDKTSFVCAVCITVNVAFVYIRMFLGATFVMIAVDYPSSAFSLKVTMGFNEIMIKDILILIKNNCFIEI